MTDRLSGVSFHWKSSSDSLSDISLQTPTTGHSLGVTQSEVDILFPEESEFIGSVTESKKRRHS